MDQIAELEDSFVEEYESAVMLAHLSKDKSATILFSKALFALADFVLFKKYRKLPKNHAERFRILEEKEPAIYRQIDDIWSRYTSVYSKPAVRESLSLLQNAIHEVAKDEAISLKIKKSVEG